MFFANIFRILGKYLFYFALVLCFPLGVAIYYEFMVPPEMHPQPHGTMAFLGSLLFCTFLALFFHLLGRKADRHLYRRESLALVVLIWIVSTLVSAAPFYLSGSLQKPLDACFEAVAGLTTTGCSLLSAKQFDPQGNEIPIKIERGKDPHKTYFYYGTIDPIYDFHSQKVLTGLNALGRAVLLWRSFLQWIGGMGIVVLFLTLLPALGVGGKLLYQMEITGPVKESVAPRIKEAASLLWKLYFGLSFVELLLLMWTNDKLSLFEAVTITFSNISTGGFSIYGSSLEYYKSLATQWIVIIFMILGSINFSLYFHILKFRFYRIYVPDLFLFLAFLLLGSLAVSLPLLQIFSIKEAFHYGIFQAISAQTSTGYVIDNYDKWPFISQMFLLLLMYVGGMAGSTSGGIKTNRFYILYKIISHRLEILFRPESVRKLYIGETEVDMKTGSLVLIFFFLVTFFTVFGSTCYILDGIDPETSLGLTACMLNNTGIAFRAASPFGSFNFLSPFSKLLSLFWMLLGRLEYFSVLVIFFRSFWRS